MVGRVWPRHSHRGRPLNSVVRCHVRATFAVTDASKDIFEVRWSWWGREEYLLNGQLLEKHWSGAGEGERTFQVAGHVVRIAFSARGSEFLGRAFVDGAIRVHELFPELKARLSHRKFSWKSSAKTIFIWLVIGLVGTYVYLGFTKGW
jgi:hypothetical protein